MTAATYDCKDNNLCDLNRSIHKTDNRYRREWAPATAKVAYGARWIDNETWCDVVPDRQGWAYDDEADRDLLLPAMKLIQNSNVRLLDFVEYTDGYYGCDAADVEGVKVSLFRNGGYVHIEVWA